MNNGILTQGQLPVGTPYGLLGMPTPAPMVNGVSADASSVPRPAIWLDAAEDTAFTLNGSSVSEWRDKSGNGRHFSQTTALAQPSRGARTQNGIRVVAFSAPQRLLGNAASRDVSGNRSGITFFIVGKYDSVAIPGGGNYAFFISRTDLMTSARAAFGVVNFLSPTGFAVFGRRNDSDAFAGASSVANTSPHVFCCSFNYGSGAARLFVDGAIAAANASWQTPGYTQNAASAALAVGSDPDGGAGNGLTGFIGEIVVYDRVLSAAEQQAVERYLGRKWSIPVA